MRVGLKYTHRVKTMISPNNPFAEYDNMWQEIAELRAYRERAYNRCLEIIADLSQKRVETLSSHISPPVYSPH